MAERRQGILISEPEFPILSQIIAVPSLAASWFGDICQEPSAHPNIIQFAILGRRRYLSSAGRHNRGILVGATYTAIAGVLAGEASDCRR
jgi:hypothetical protein